MNTTAHAVSTVQQLNRHAVAFVADLERFSPALISFLKTCHFDHAAMKSQDKCSFEAERDDLLRHARAASYVALGERQVAVFELRSPVTVPGFGTTSVVEIIEPRFELYGRSPKGIEHLEFCAPNQQEVADSLTRLGIPFSTYDYRHHQGILVEVGSTGRTIKFMNTPLQRVIGIETKNGETKEFAGMPRLTGQLD